MILKFQYVFLAISIFLVKCLRNSSLDNQTVVKATTNPRNLEHKTIVSRLDVESRKSNSSQKNSSKLELKLQESEKFTPSVAGRERCGSSSGKCSSGISHFKNQMSCYCDQACFEIFNDCCDNYLQQCRVNNTSSEQLDSSSWKCVGQDFRPTYSRVRLRVPSAWMIQQCPSNWSSTDDKFRDTKSKCEKASNWTSWTFASVVEDYLPVVAENSFTYRNKHCAICNGIKNHTSWTLEFKNSSKFSAQNSSTNKIEYVVSIKPSKEQPRRYCQSNLISLTTDLPHIVITSSIINIYKVEMILLPVEIVYYFCPEQMVYHRQLQKCRPTFQISGAILLKQQFFVALWLLHLNQRQHAPSPNTNLQKTIFKRNIAARFKLALSQISSIQFRHQSTLPPFGHQDSNREYTVASFHLTYESPEQINRSNPATHGKLQALWNATWQNFTIEVSNSSWLVIKMIRKQLSCFENKTYSYDEYNLDKTTGMVVHNKTGKKILIRDFTFLAETAENFTLCRQFLFSDCNETYINISRHEYVLQSDLSLYYKTAKQTFSFGTYYINDYIKLSEEADRKEHNVLEDVARDQMAFICVPNQKYYEVRKPVSNPHKKALEILTICGFLISIFSLLLFLITYSLFSELRTTPGKNLMNLCLSLFLFQSLWPVRSFQEPRTIGCSVVGVLEHYLVLVSFVAMSVISYHSCIIFSKHIIASRRSKSEEQKLFFKYSLIVWLPAAVFVGACVAVDKTGVFLINYRRRCWLDTAMSKIYLFLLPIGLSVLFHISAFLRTVKFLIQHKKQTSQLRKNRKRNLLICIKLSTVTGFPWIFSFLGAYFEDVVAFDYLFTIFVCFQGFFIAVAFLTNSRIRNFYKKSLAKGNESTNLQEKRLIRSKESRV